MSKTKSENQDNEKKIARKSTFRMKKIQIKHTLIYDDNSIIYSENVLAITKLLNILKRVL